MGIRSVLVELDRLERYYQIKNFTDSASQKYDIIGLIYHRSTDKYYVLVECHGEFFCKLLAGQFPGLVHRLEEFSIEHTPTGYRILGAIYFNTLDGCLNHYLTNTAMAA